MGENGEAIERSEFLNFAESWRLLLGGIIAACLQFLLSLIFLLLMSMVLSRPSYSVLFLSFQITVGLFMNRILVDLGHSAKKRVSLIDAGVFEQSREFQETVRKSTEVSHIFERWSIRLEKANQASNDDMSDIFWFLIIVTSVLGASHLVLVDTGPFFLLAVNLLFAIYSLSALVTSYQDGSLTHLMDDLFHLEYLITSRMRAIESTIENRSMSILIHWKKIGGKFLLFDICMNIEVLTKRIKRIVYCMGLSSSESEAIEVEMGSYQKGSAQELAVTTLENAGWVSSSSSNETFMRFEMHDHSVDFAKRWTYVMSPNTIQEKNKEAVWAVQRVLHLV